MLDITPEEKAILEQLGQCWNAYVKLPEQHPMDAGEFAAAIHRCQDMVASRVVYRRLALEHQRRN